MRTVRFFDDALIFGPHISDVLLPVDRDTYRYYRTLMSVVEGYSDHLDRYKKESGLEGIAILSFHGDPDGDVWYFMDGERAYKVSNWLKKMDGRFLAYFLCMCARPGIRVDTQKSAVFHGEGILSINGIARRENPMRLYIPGQGYVR